MVARQRPCGYPRAKRGAERDKVTARRTLDFSTSLRIVDTKNL